MLWVSLANTSFPSAGDLRQPQGDRRVDFALVSHVHDAIGEFASGGVKDQFTAPTTGPVNELAVDSALEAIGRRAEEL